MSSKTPYEIRANLLHLAQGICNDKNWASRQALENDWNVKRDEWQIKAANGEFLTPPSFPQMPTVSTEEVIAEARKLNDFVSNG